MSILNKIKSFLLNEDSICADLRYKSGQQYNIQFTICTKQFFVLQASFYYRYIRHYFQF